jgi:protein phosphatase
LRNTNEDCILVNGTLLFDGSIHLTYEQTCFCFVADGVGGNNAGEFASRFVLEQLKEVFDNGHDDLEKRLHHVNTELLSVSSTDLCLKGAATTLSGIIINDSKFQIIHAGDSQIWLLRDDSFFQITIDHVEDDSVENSSITNYFGGLSDHLHFDAIANVIDPSPDDIFLICTDGIFKSMKSRIVKSILSSDKDIAEKSEQLMLNCLLHGADDNISAIIVKISESNG